MAFSRLALSLLLTVSVGWVHAQTPSMLALLRLAASNEPAGTDHTGEITSFSDVGEGGGTLPPRPWGCYTVNSIGVKWLLPNGDTVVSGTGVATGNQLFTADFDDGRVILFRGPTHFSPDGEHCCVRTATNDRICVTFTPCPTLSPLSNGVISYNAINNIATYTCNLGYTISGATPIACMSDGTSAGTWSPTPPTVNCTIVTCPVLTPPTNGALSITSRNYLTVVAYSCDTGYVLTGNSDAARQCQATGIWSGEEPTCQPVDCGALGNPNGAVDTSSGTTFNQMATYSCISGYMISGATTRTCQASGLWSLAPPTCEPVNCNGLPNPSNGVVDTFAGTTFMMTATYTCSTGYLLIGDTSRTCQATGAWSGSAPTCLPINVVIIPSGIAMAGQSFSLTCSLSGGASLQPTLSYQWTREGRSLMTSTATLNFDTLYLSDAGQYSCQVILTSSQLEGEHTTVASHHSIEFMTFNIQLRLGVITNCEGYIESETMAKATDITNRLSQGVGFSPSLLTDEFINCFDGSSSHVTYRAVLTGTETVSVVELISLIEQWIGDTSNIIVQSTRLGLTNTCPVVIADRDSPECPEDITNRTQMATPTSSIAAPTSSIATTSPTESVVVNVGAVAGGVVAGVLAIAVLVLIVIVVLLLLRQRRSGSKDMSDEKTGSQPTELAPVVMSNLPSHDYEELSKLQEEVAYEVVGQPHSPPPADYQLSACAAYAPTDFNTDNK